MFESLSRTVTCTGELSALICVIPGGTELIPPCLNYHISVLYTVVQLLSGCCPVDHKYLMYWMLTINDMCYSRGDGINTSLSKLSYLSTVHGSSVVVWLLSS